MEKIRNLSRIALATLAISVAQACNSEEDSGDRGSNINVSDCTSPSIEHDQLIRRQDVKKIEDEVRSGEDHFNFSVSLFPLPGSESIPGKAAWVGGDGVYHFEMDQPAELVDFFRNETNIIDSFSKSKTDLIYIVFEYYFEGRDDTATGSATTFPGSRRVIMLYFKPESEINKQDLSQLIFHEGMHIIYDEIGGVENGHFDEGDSEGQSVHRSLSDNKERSYSEFVESLSEYGQDLTSYYLDGELKLPGDLFNLVTESCYLGDGGEGHPQDNPSEMFASTATIMKFFPRSYLENIDGLNVEDKQKMETLSSYVLGRLVSNAKNKKVAKAQFDPEIVERFLP